MNEIENETDIENITDIKCVGKITSEGEIGKCGEDNYIIHDSDNYIILGVIDGVGGWNNVQGLSKNIIPIFTYELSQKLKKHIKEYLKKNRIELVDKYVMKDWVIDVLNELYNNNIHGSSTLLICIINKKNGKCKIYNIGDSKMMIIRDKKMESGNRGGLEDILITESQQFNFNAPYQVGSNPPENNRFSKSRFNDKGEYYEIDLEQGDFLLLGTDGLWDNLDILEIIQIIEKEYNNLNDINDIKKISNKLIEESKKRMLNMTTSKGPWVLEYEKHNNKLVDYTGKYDDITLISTLII